MKTALITGITGQDGAYLADFLLAQQYRVVGLARGTSIKRANLARLDCLGVTDRIELHQCDITDGSAVASAAARYLPDEIYNLAAQSFVPASWGSPVHTANVNAIGALNIIEAVRHTCPRARIYQASTSEMFGLTHVEAQSECTPFYPRSPYGVAKLFAHWSMINARESHDLFACCGILFNHESPLRGEEFVTRKVTRAAARIKAGLQDKLLLGNQKAKRDWGHARDYVRAMWLMLQQQQPVDYVIATGESHTVEEMVEIAFARVGLNPKDHVEISTKLYRPAEVPVLLGDAKKARMQLRWQPTTSFRNLIQEMVDFDLKLAEKESRL